MMNLRVLATILLLVLVFMSTKEAMAILRQESTFLDTNDGSNKKNFNMKTIGLILALGSILSLIISTFYIGLAMLLTGWTYLLYIQLIRSSNANYIRILVYLIFAVSLIFIEHPLLN